VKRYGPDIAIAALDRKPSACRPDSGSRINGHHFLVAGRRHWGTRLQRMVGEQGLACRVTPPCAATLQKAGASAGLIHDLQKLDLQKSTAKEPCACSGDAAQVATLLHEKEVRRCRKQDPRSAPRRRKNPWLHFAYGTVLRQRERFEEAFDAFEESSRLMPGFPENPQPALLSVLPAR